MIWAFHLAFWLTPTRIARPVSRAGLLGEPITNSQRGLSADVDPAIGLGGRPHRLMTPQWASLSAFELLVEMYAAVGLHPRLCPLLHISPRLDDETLVRIRPE